MTEKNSQPQLLINSQYLAVSNGKARWLFMKYKSVGLAAVAVIFGALCAEAANQMETGVFTTGLSVASNASYKLETGKQGTATCFIAGNRA
ncbi:MAG: hypothetical protein HY796_06255 [Elusimicrobia bacterium]|nr:hypothetical protein [Elusimicrobiota bacterium]